MKKTNFIKHSVYNTKVHFQRAFAPRMLPVTLLSVTVILAAIFQWFTSKDSSGIAYAATIVGLANCASPDSIFNVGVPPCDLKKKKMKGVIFADAGVAFTGADIASKAAFIQAVKDKCTAARGSRVYPIWDLLNFVDNTGEPGTGSIGNLTTATIIVNDAIPAFRYGYNGTEARHKRIAQISGASLDVFFVDEGWTVYGTDDGAGGFKGFNVLQAYADTSKFPVADAVDQYSLRITLGSISEYRDNSLYVVADSTLSTAFGLVNINLSKFSQVANVFKTYIKADGGTDLYTLYGAALAALTWTATNLQTNAAFTITSVATDGANGVLVITFDSTAFTALASGDRLQLNMPTTAAMAAASVKPFEGIPIIVTKP
ncbi:hypothetical protein GAMM_230006 [Gammaproteobacteria bacterium]